MPVYWTSYDLSTPGQKYACLEKAIRTEDSQYLKYVESSWIVKYSGDPDALN